jgi:hypothetical protein
MAEIGILRVLSKIILPPTSFGETITINAYLIGR